MPPQPPTWQTPIESRLSSLEARVNNFEQRAKDMHEQNREILRLHAERVKDLSEVFDERVKELRGGLDYMRNLLTGTLAAAVLGIFAQIVLHFIGVH